MLFDSLPGQVPSHFNARGVADAYMDRATDATSDTRRPSHLAINDAREASQPQEAFVSNGTTFNGEEPPPGAITGPTYVPGKCSITSAGNRIQFY